MRSKFKKSLGQNFLVDKNIQRKIIAACDFKPSDIVLEIGAGRGELTGLIASKVALVYPLELDPVLSKILKAKLAAHANIQIIKGDILKFNLRSSFLNLKDKIKVVGNIPYYISSPILEHLLKFRDKIEAIFITVQKEFAARVCALPGSKVYAALSCFVQYYLEPKAVFNIKKASFFPAPKVDSTFLRFKVRERPLVRVEDEKLFFRIIRQAFNYRRKTLRNSLKNIVSTEKLEDFFAKYGIDSNTRPEKFSLQDFANLTNS